VTDLRTREQAGAWLSAGLCLARVGTPSADWVRRVAPWVSAAAAEVPLLPPAGVIADLGDMICGSSPSFDGSMAPTPRLREALRAYEDQVLGRLVGERRLEAVVDAVARVGPRNQARAVALFTDLLLTRIGFEGNVAVSPGAVRRVLGQPANEVMEAGLTAIRDRDQALQLLAEGYEALVAASRRAPHLIGDMEVFTVENLDALSGLGERRALGGVLDAAEWLDRRVPRHVKRRRRQQGPTPTHLAAESSYPIGGFSSITNSGSFENLVSSELMYMEPDAEDPVDLFVVRWAESELLFYTRDESVLVRRRRAVHVVLDATLVRARFKDRDTPWQRATLLMASVVVVLRRLVDWLGERDLDLTVWVANNLDAEQDLLSLALLELIERNTCTVRDHNPQELLEHITEDLTRGRSDLVWLGADLPPELDERVGVVRLDLPDGRPVASGATGAYALPPDKPLDQLAPAVGELLRDVA
jgi:hypothetical protein